MAGIWIRDGQCIDPATGRVAQRDVYVVDGLLQPRPSDHELRAAREIDAAGCIVMPGAIDVHVHLREPGGEAAETIASGAAAALRGGVTGVVAMPNTQPPIDTPERVAYVIQQGQAAGAARVWTTACLTVGRAGRAVAPLADMAHAGAVAFTDDGATVQDDAVMRTAMREAARLNLPVMDHAQDRMIECLGGVMNDGPAARARGVPGIPAEAEWRIVARDIRLAEETGCAVHIQHVSCGHSVDLIADAQQRGVRVTAEATPHHLWFADEEVDIERPDRFKMNPPLRTSADRDRLREGVQEGVLTILATDHAPHSQVAKARGFLDAPFGVIGLETALAATYTRLVQPGHLSALHWVQAWTTHPARLLGRSPPSLADGQPADVVVFDPKRTWTVRAEASVSRSQNSCFDSCALNGYPCAVILNEHCLINDWSP